MDNKKGTIAISQIFVLIIGIVAVSYAVGGQIGFISGQEIPVGEAVRGHMVFGEGASIPADVAKPVPKELLTDPGFFEKIGSAGKNIWNFGSGEGFTATVTSILVHAVIVIAITYVVLNIAVKLGAPISKDQIDDASKAAGAGWLAGEGARELILLAGFSGPVVVGIGIAIGVATFVKLFTGFRSKFDSREALFECKYWQPEAGGKNCEKCNDQLIPCTEYQCKTFGKDCILIDRETSDSICVWENERDQTEPTITARKNSLEDNYCYKPLAGTRGVEVKYDENARNGACTNTVETCLPAFQSFSFGISLDKFGTCRMDDHRTNNFSSMELDFGGANWPIKEQTQTMIFPNTAYLIQEGVPIEIHNGGNYEYYVRCENLNGQWNRQEFLFKFCVDSEPDFSDPIITFFRPLDKTPIRFFKENESREIPVEIHINKPSECKWSHFDKGYDKMENNLTCSSNVLDPNSRGVYPCTGTLTEFENRKENKYYFRCRDPYFNITHQQSRVLTLIGTESLVISSVKPENGTVLKGSTDRVKVNVEVTTSAGFENGKASCGYSLTGNFNDFEIFENTDSHQHSTEIFFEEGDHDLYIQCFDGGGNAATTFINFIVERDTSIPSVVRAYRDANSLTILTSEEAQCVYDVQSCSYNFGDGLNMTRTLDKITHTVSWDSDKTYYIKCADDFGNQPNFDQCSITVKPFDI